MPISIPKFFQRAFAQNGSKQNVPVTGDTSGGRASYDVGFPPVTRVPIVAGGIPPFGTDFNGILYDLSQAIQYLQSGVTFPFDQDFADAIGGYSIKAIVADPVDPTILWQNNNANNTLPPSVPNGWEQVFSAADLLRNPTTVLRGAPLLASVEQAQGGTAQGVMVDPKTLKDAGLWPLGVGQAWQNLTASRALNTNYTNTTGRSIAISVFGTTNAGVRVLLDGVDVSTNGFNVSSSLSTFLVIPAGAVYRVEIAVTKWMELR